MLLIAWVKSKLTWKESLELKNVKDSFLDKGMKFINSKNGDSRQDKYNMIKKYYSKSDRIKLKKCCKQPERNC